MPYVTPAEIMAQSLSPSSQNALRILPTLLNLRRAQKEWETRKPYLEAQGELAKEKAAQIKKARELYNQMMGGTGEALPEGKTPQDILGNPFARMYLGLPALTYNSKTIYGPEGKTKSVAVPKGQNYVPPEGWTLNKPGSSQLKTKQYLDDRSGRMMKQDYVYDAAMRKETPVGEPYVSQDEKRNKMEWWAANGQKYSDWFSEREWSKAQDIIRKTGGRIEKPEMTGKAKTKRIEQLLGEKAKIERSRITIKQKGSLDAFAMALGKMSGMAPVTEGQGVTPNMLSAYEQALDRQAAQIDKELKELGYKEPEKDQEDEVTDYIRRKLGQ